MKTGRSLFTVLVVAGYLGGFEMVCSLSAQSATTNAPGDQRQKYEAAMTVGKMAYTKKNYGEAIQQAETALANLAGDAGATQLKTEAQRGQSELTMQAEREKKLMAARVQPDRIYESAMRAAQEEFEQKKYSAALLSVEKALAVKPIDAKAILLRDDIRDKMSKANAAKEQEEKQAQGYQAAMLKVRAAFDVQDYTNAVTWAEATLKIKPGDADATDLRARALSKVNSSEKLAARLDEQLEIMLVTFRVLNPKDARFPAARESKIMTGSLAPDGAAACLKQVEDINRQLQTPGLLTAERQKKLATLTRAIKNWD